MSFLMLKLFLLLLLLLQLLFSSLCTAQKVAPKLVSIDSLQHPTNPKEEGSLKTLRYVQTLSRHGDRAPARLIPTDTENGASTWKEGVGNVTAKGKIQQYQLGRLLRRRYDGFLSSEYNPREAVFRTSEYVRAQRSALALLSGLYPQSTKDASSKDQIVELVEKNFAAIQAGHPERSRYQIVTPPTANDRYVFDEVKCDVATEMEHGLYKTPQAKAIEQKNADFLRFLAEKSGYEKNPVPLKEIGRIYDPLKVEIEHLDEGHKWPRWVNQSVFARIERLYDLSTSLLYKSDVTKKLWSGPLFAKIVERMQNATAKGGKKALEATKFYGYVGHDLNVAGLLSILGVDLVHFPSYSTMVILELHVAENGTNFVKLFHKNETHSERLWEYQIANCGPPCTVEDLLSTRRQFIPNDWDKECKASTPANKEHRLRHRRQTSTNNIKNSTTTTETTEKTKSQVPTTPSPIIGGAKNVTEEMTTTTEKNNDSHHHHHNHSEAEEEMNKTPKNATTPPKTNGAPALFSGNGVFVALMAALLAFYEKNF